ncbi:MAG TPA: hypothetical protein VIL36_04460, partial [Acidimicrobiales bacterium]
VVRMTTWRARFVAGDYPMVCARTGLPADKVVPVEAARRADWPWFLIFVSVFAWLLSWWSIDRDRIWGRLPFARGHVGGVSATWDRERDIVTLHGVHPDFVAACHEHQARPQPSS